MSRAEPVPLRCRYREAEAVLSRATGKRGLTDKMTEPVAATVDRRFREDREKEERRRRELKALDNESSSSSSEEDDSPPVVLPVVSGKSSTASSAEHRKPQVPALVLSMTDIEYQAIIRTLQEENESRGKEHQESIDELGIVLEKVRKEKADVEAERDRYKAERDRLMPSPRKVHIKMAFIVGGAIGWLIAVAYAALWLWMGLCILFSHNNNKSQPLYPYDPLTHLSELPTCVEECLALATPTGGSVSRCEHVVPVAAQLRELASTNVSKSLRIYGEKLAWTVDLRVLRASMQHKIHSGKHDFMCAEFLGFPLGYCIALLAAPQQYPNSTSSEWVDIAGNVTLTSIDYGTTLIANLEVPSSLCKTANSRNLTVVTARYFQSVCIRYTTALGSVIERCLSNRDALVVQQMFEWQRGIDLCAAGEAHTAAIIEALRQSIKKT